MNDVLRDSTGRPVELDDPMWWMRDYPLSQLEQYARVVFLWEQYQAALGRFPEATARIRDNPTFRLHKPYLATCGTCGEKLDGDPAAQQMEKHGEATGHRTFRMTEMWPWELSAALAAKPRLLDVKGNRLELSHR